ncbi:NUDIX domain-containing protein [Candidatus Daviesbacteria bacterium]|nr:NUDIX domain-containing protein [Candidatus Daviesbacteria bacterium]
MGAVLERVAGVGAFVVDPARPGQFAAVREREDKRATAKLRGMWAIPCETVEPGESHQSAAERIFREELQVKGLKDPDDLASIRLGACELSPGIVLHAYLIETAPGARLSLGSHSHEVDSPRWARIDEVLNLPLGNLSFRPGVFEVVTGYLAFKSSNSHFIPGVYRHYEVRNQIPQEVFDQLEVDARRIPVLSPIGVHLQPGLGLSA